MVKMAKFYEGDIAIIRGLGKFTKVSEFNWLSLEDGYTILHEFWNQETEGWVELWKPDYTDSDRLAETFVGEVC